jgi:hypothetical protein
VKSYKEENGVKGDGGTCFNGIFVGKGIGQLYLVKLFVQLCSQIVL